MKRTSILDGLDGNASRIAIGNEFHLYIPVAIPCTHSRVERCFVKCAFCSLELHVGHDMNILLSYANLKKRLEFFSSFHNMLLAIGRGYKTLLCIHSLVERCFVKCAFLFFGTSCGT